MPLVIPKAASFNLSAETCHEPPPESVCNAMR